MGIFTSGNDDKLDFLEEERIKIWRLVRTLEEESRALKQESLVLKEAVAKKEVVKTVTKLTAANKRVVAPKKGEMEIIVPKTN